MSRPLRAIELLLDGSRGFYIPRDFVEGTLIGGEFGWQGITEENVKDLSEPDNEWYWDTWETVLNNATYISACGKKYTLYQDGDLFAICFDMLTETERVDLGFDL